MKIIPLSIAKSYVNHWGWWEGIRELLQNAVDTGDYDVITTHDGKISITSRGGKIPVESLLMGKSSKADDENTIGKFGEGMKLSFLVLSRLGAEVYVHNVDEIWRPSFQYNDTFESDCLVVGVYSADKVVEHVEVVITGIPQDIIDLVKERFIPLKGVTPAYVARNGEAYEPSDPDHCNLYVNGIFVTKLQGKYRFDYNFRPGAFTLDRDRNTAKDFEVKWEASRLLMEANQFILVVELSSSGYKDVEEIRYHSNYASEDQSKVMKERACDLFIEQYGTNTWPINRNWTPGKKTLITKALIAKGYVPVEVHDSLYDLLKEEFCLDESLEELVAFQPIQFLEKFLKDHKRNMRAKPIKKLEATLEALKTLRG